MNTITYKEYVDPYFHGFEKIVLNDNDIYKVKRFVSKLIEVKKNESHHIKDPANQMKRWTTGLLGELAIEKLMGKDFVDYTIGKSKVYDKPDLSKLGINCGIKTSEKGKFPLVRKKSTHPEIILIKESDKVFYVCGIAVEKVLNNLQSDDLILSPYLRKSGSQVFMGLSTFFLLSALKPW